MNNKKKLEINYQLVLKYSMNLVDIKSIEFKR